MSNQYTESSNQAMFESITIKSESEVSAGHETISQSTTKEQRAYLEHIAQATLALMGEPVYDQAGVDAELQHAYSPPAVSAVSTQTDQSYSTGKSMKIENGGVELQQDKKGECAGKIEVVEKLADVRRVESRKDSGSLGENVATSTRWLRLSEEQQHCSRVVGTIEKFAEVKHFESSEEVEVGGNIDEDVCTSNRWLRLL